MRDYLNIAGKLLKLIPNNDTDGTCSLAVADQSNIFTGTAAGGTTTTLLDVDKNFEADSVKGRMIRFVLNSIEFVRKITACTGSQVTFGATIPDIGASLALGSGLDAEGKVEIHCKGDLIGKVGDDYSVQIVQGTATTGDDVATLDEENKILLITVNLTALEEPRTLAAGSLQTLLANTVGIADKFEIPDGFTAGNIPMTTGPIPFTGGQDGLPVVAGTKYTIFP